MTKLITLFLEFRRQFLSGVSGDSRNVLTYKPKSAAKAQTWPRSAPARLPCRVARKGERVAVSAWCGLDAHVPGNATRQRADSHSPPLGRNGAKRHFWRGGTYACSAVTPCGVVQTIESQSAWHVGRVRHAARVRRDASLTATLARSAVARVTRPGSLIQLTSYMYISCACTDRGFLSVSVSVKIDPMPCKGLVACAPLAVPVVHAY